MPIRIAPCLALFCAVHAAVPVEGTAETAGSAAEDCARFEALEADGRAQVRRLLAEIDLAAEGGETEAFCAASADLVYVYRAMSRAAAACDAARATSWAEAEAQTNAALGAACP